MSCYGSATGHIKRYQMSYISQNVIHFPPDFPSCVHVYVIPALRWGCRALRRPLLSFFLLATHTHSLSQWHRNVPFLSLNETDRGAYLSRTAVPCLFPVALNSSIGTDRYSSCRQSPSLNPHQPPRGEMSAYQAHRSPRLISGIHCRIFYLRWDSTLPQAFIRVLKLAGTQSSAGIDDISGGLLLGLSMKRIERACALLFWGKWSRIIVEGKEKEETEVEEEAGGRFSQQLSQFVPVSQKSTDVWQDGFFFRQSKSSLYSVLIRSPLLLMPSAGSPTRLRPCLCWWSSWRWRRWGRLLAGLTEKATDFSHRVNSPSQNVVSRKKEKTVAANDRFNLHSPERQF